MAGFGPSQRFARGLIKLFYTQELAVGITEALHDTVTNQSSSLDAHFLLGGNIQRSLLFPPLVTRVNNASIVTNYSCLNDVELTAGQVRMDERFGQNQFFVCLAFASPADRETIETAYLENCVCSVLITSLCHASVSFRVTLIRLKPCDPARLFIGI